MRRSKPFCRYERTAYSYPRILAPWPWRSTDGPMGIQLLAGGGAGGIGGAPSMTSGAGAKGARRCRSWHVRYCLISEQRSETWNGCCESSNPGGRKPSGAASPPSSASGSSASVGPISTGGGGGASDFFRSFVNRSSKKARDRSPGPPSGSGFLPSGSFGVVGCFAICLLPNNRERARPAYRRTNFVGHTRPRGAVTWLLSMTMERNVRHNLCSPQPGLTGSL